ncbi:MAG: DMT family transporter [SAR202 cluster bacterium]|nr:DMT family transporter [SAR202 cluster bacterium]|tara:strand:- start:51345 stop:51815 length:471 start_codon:yes stop_codon:yes gene_type:complete
MQLNIKTRQNKVIIGYILAFMSAIGYGTGTVVTKHVINIFPNPILVSSISLIIGTAIISIFYIKNLIQDLSNETPIKELSNAIFAGISSALGVNSLFIGLKFVPVSVASPVANTFPLVTIIIMKIFYGKLEKISLETILGSLLIVSGIIIITIYTS